MVWYENMLKLNWNKEIFLKRIEAVQRQEIFNRIGWDTWIRADSVMYADHEIQRIVDAKVNTMIIKGSELIRLYKSGYALTDEEKKIADIAAIKELEFEIKSERSRLIDEAKEAIKNRKRNELKTKRAKIAMLTRDQKIKLLNECISKNIFDESQYEIYLNYLEHFADLIPNSLIQKETK